MKKYYDAVIVGCGVAGCFAALHLPQEADILMITKADTEDSDSFLAQGGICVLKTRAITMRSMKIRCMPGTTKIRRNPLTL